MYTIKDLSEGRVAVINNGSVSELRELLRLAFPSDYSRLQGSERYYYGIELYGDNSWTGDFETNLPTQSVKDFLIEERKLAKTPEYVSEVDMYGWYRVDTFIPSDEYDGFEFECEVEGAVGVYYFVWRAEPEAFCWGGQYGAFVDDVLYWRRS